MIVHTAFSIDTTSEGIARILALLQDASQMLGTVWIDTALRFNGWKYKSFIIMLFHAHSNDLNPNQR